LNDSQPNWKDSFIHSPLENESLRLFISDNLYNNLLLQFIVLYLLFMLLIIISCRILLKNNIDLGKFKKSKISVFFFSYLELYINIWRVSSNAWIYFILFSVMIFISASTFSIYSILELLKN
jgi:hypothetical protein